jgi:hypothetical protein
VRAAKDLKESLAVRVKRKHNRAGKTSKVDPRQAEVLLK